MSRKRLLILLLIVLCAAIIYSWMETPRQRRVTESAPDRKVSTGRDVPQLDVAPEIEDLDFSGGSEHKYQKPKKNLFAALYQPPKAVVKRQPRKPKAKPKAVKVAPKVIQPVVQIPRPVGPPPMKPLNFLGHLKKDGQMTAFLSSYKGDIFLVKKGDKFAGNLEVSELTATEIIIRNMDTGQQVIQEVKTVKAQRLPRTNFKSGRPSSAIPKAVPVNKQVNENQDK